MEQAIIQACGHWNRSGKRPAIFGAAGFTIIEIVSVMLLMGIFTVVAVTFLINSNEDVTAEADRLKGNLRFAQYLAMTNNTSVWSVSISSTGYTLQKNGSPAPLNFPDATSPTHSFPSGVSVTAGTGTITYDEWGSPGTSSHVITFSDGTNVTVTKNTGFIP